ncbi:MAG: helix-turn-helix domain-containing protein [Nitrosomonas sp.]|uniref:helix-turn-helix domain-containing protein n=1 Tax=Nitrosomonas sp. TaxID=42353 RepID=UPI0025DE8CA0|nr:helix-turn-helix transcriptional regulator [Nitrosomonas sp.]MBY0475432.1 helix-turn-helix domain-containing protein [Nitrosomonas sp.]
MARVVKYIPKTEDRTRLVKMLGKRLREAREIHGLSQSQAAKRLGYSNSSKLAKIEAGSDTNSIPLWLIVRAAKLYHVSIDFLFGESSDWEMSAEAITERETQKWLFEAWEQGRKDDMDKVRRLQDRINAVTKFMKHFFGSSVDLEIALEKFIELNPEFNEMKGSNTLLSRVEKISELTRTSRTKLEIYAELANGINRFKIDSNPQPRLFQD